MHCQHSMYHCYLLSTWLLSTLLYQLLRLKSRSLASPQQFSRSSAGREQWRWMNRHQEVSCWCLLLPQTSSTIIRYVTGEVRTRSITFFWILNFKFLLPLLCCGFYNMKIENSSATENVFGMKSGLKWVDKELERAPQSLQRCANRNSALKAPYGMIGVTTSEGKCGRSVEGFSRYTSNFKLSNSKYRGISILTYILVLS